MGGVGTHPLQHPQIPHHRRNLLIPNRLHPRHPFTRNAIAHNPNQLRIRQRNRLGQRSNRRPLQAPRPIRPMTRRTSHRILPRPHIPLRQPVHPRESQHAQANEHPHKPRVEHRIQCSRSAFACHSAAKRRNPLLSSNRRKSGWPILSASSKGWVTARHRPTSPSPPSPSYPAPNNHLPHHLHLRRPSRQRPNRRRSQRTPRPLHIHLIPSPSPH